MERKLQISDLAVGDWVRIGDCGEHSGEQGKVVAISLESNYVGILTTHIIEECEDDVFPIPITPEILDKNWFTREWGAFTHITMVGDKVRTISFKEGYLLVSKRGARKNAFEYPDTEAQIAIPCLYVHELQHALRLAGIEKEIEL